MNSLLSVYHTPPRFSRTFQKKKPDALFYTRSGYSLSVFAQNPLTGGLPLYASAGICQSAGGMRILLPVMIISESVMPL